MSAHGDEFSGEGANEERTPHPTAKMSAIELARLHPDAVMYDDNEDKKTESNRNDVPPDVRSINDITTANRYNAITIGKMVEDARLQKKVEARLRRTIGEKSYDLEQLKEDLRKEISSHAETKKALSQKEKDFNDYKNNKFHFSDAWNVFRGKKQVQS